MYIHKSHAFFGDHKHGGGKFEFWIIFEWEVWFLNCGSFSNFRYFYIDFLWDLYIQTFSDLVWRYCLVKKLTIRKLVVDWLDCVIWQTDAEMVECERKKASFGACPNVLQSVTFTHTYEKLFWQNPYLRLRTEISHLSSLYFQNEV